MDGWWKKFFSLLNQKKPFIYFIFLHESIYAHTRAQGLLLINKVQNPSSPSFPPP